MDGVEVPGDRLDVVCIGETMVSFVATGEPDLYRAIVAGAESNVAMGLARLGCRTGWVSRIGDDPFGRLVEQWVIQPRYKISCSTVHNCFAC